MKENLCKTLDFDCWVNDFMAVSNNDYILTDEGYEFIKNKYSSEIEKFINEMTLQHEQEQQEENERYKEYLNLKEEKNTDLNLSELEELPFE